MKKISIMIPTYNEEENVIPLHSAVSSLFSNELKEYDYEILFIDNKSVDNTRQKIRQVCAENIHTKAIFNVKNFGQFNSPYHGLIGTTGDCAIQLCADFQDPVELIPQMVREWENGYKVVCCVKTSSKESKVMYFLRSVYYKMIKKMSSVEQIEHFTGFGLYDKSFIETLRSLHDPIPFIRGIVAELGPERKVIEYQQAKRRAGKTKNNWYTLYDGAMISFTSYTKIGLRIATIVGFLIAALSLVVALVYLVLKLIWWDSFPAGNLPTLFGVFILGGFQIFFIGLVGEYIINMNTRIMNRPLVIEEERINFNNED